MPSWAKSNRRRTWGGVSILLDAAAVMVNLRERSQDR